MDMKTMEKLEDGFCKVLHDNAERGFASASSVELAKTALSGLVKLKMLKEMDSFNIQITSIKNYMNTVKEMKH